MSRIEKIFIAFLLAAAVSAGILWAFPAAALWYVALVLLHAGLGVALLGLGLAACYRANVWNIGAEGQFVLGAIAAGGVALQAGDDTTRWVLVPILFAGVLGGMAWAGIVAFLRDR